ncbi:MAG TPA: TonB-dependent receptor plug domain-containing protein, partial [Niabella sp.]|nr:TonB-dependent receptor plug domain-containing protein [Niabella sp.]
MKKGFISMIGLLQILITAQKINAQEQTLDPITVTSSLAEKRISETGRNITIIRGDDISKLPVHSLDELLKYIPGVEVQMRGPQGSQSDISMRGGTFQQVLVILDGLRLNDPNTGHFSAYIPITPAQIERIEVPKGASAAIYGSDAVGGVINIITKSFRPGQKNTRALQAQVSAGEYNLVNTSIGGFLQAGKLS